MWFAPLLPASVLLAWVPYQSAGPVARSTARGGSVVSPANAPSATSAALQLRTTMAVIGSYNKQPWEAFRVSIDYAQHAGTAEITAVAPDITVPAGMDLLGQAVSGSVLRLYIGGGADGQVYTWRIRSTLSTVAGELARVEDEFLVLVEEIVGDVGKPDGAFTAAGATANRIEQTEGDDRTYLIDCAALLRPYELLTGITSLTPGSGLTASGQALRQGRYLEVTLAGTADVGPPYTDRTLRAVFTSTRGTVRGAITLRVYPA